MDIDQQLDLIPERWRLGEGWIICVDCGARLSSYDIIDDPLIAGKNYDIGRKCPYPLECS